MTIGLMRVKEIGVKHQFSIKMKIYKLQNTSHQIITYVCIVKANSKKEATNKARKEPWVEIKRRFKPNNIEITLKKN